MKRTLSAVFFAALLFVGQRLPRMLQADWSRRVAEAYQDAGHPSIPEPQSAIQSRTAIHLRCRGTRRSAARVRSTSFPRRMARTR